MKHIESRYEHYEDLVTRIGVDKIESRYKFLYEQMAVFIDRMGAKEKLRINERILLHCVLEYFEDIEKVKNAHGLEHTNGPKVMAYSVQWLLRRQPIQILTEDDADDALVFANEKFVLSMLMNFLTCDQETKPLIGDELKAYQGFLNSFLYYLKFRKLDAQSIEMILLAFNAGKIFGNN